MVKDILSHFKHLKNVRFMRKFYNFVWAIILLSFLTIDANAQDLVERQVNGANGAPEFVLFNVDHSQAYRSTQTTDVLRQYLQLKKQDEMRSAKVETDRLGMQHQKFQQYFKGIKVEYGTYNVHTTRGGQVQAINGEFKQVGTDLNTTPTLSEERALAIAMRYIGAESYMWQNEEHEAWHQRLEEDKNASFHPKGELVVVENYLAADRKAVDVPTLAYKFDIYAEKPLSRDYVYVDAHNGEVVHINPIIKHVGEATGTCASRYSGSLTMKTDSYNGSYRLRDYSRGNGIMTYDCNEGTSYNSAVDFVDGNNSWTSGEWNNANKDNAAFDAQWGAQMTYDYFIQKHNRNSYDNNGASIRSYVHYSSNYENAFWNGSVMTYGDGNTRFDALTSLDVAAHEIGHAVTTFTANLAYQRESGGLNEGFSDIWGACVEYYAAPSKQRWLIGEDIDKQRPSLRSMSNPNAEGQPDCYGGSYWKNPNCGTPTQSNDYCGVHTNSGVLNFWFYLLTEGGSGTNDVGNSYSVSGIGIDDAAQVAYRTLSVYLSANSTFANARTYSIQSAVELYGAGSAQEISVTNAWHGVNVGDAYAGGGGNPPPSCNDNAVTLTITSDNYGSETTWTVKNSNGTTVASGGPYANNTTTTHDLCLADGCYDFTINDSYGDGICCGYGNGSYSISDAGGSLASGGSFGSSETKNFCVGGGGGPTPTCNDGTQNGDETGVDCGGSCSACPSCNDGVQNGNETGVDCGGSCSACPSCNDGVQNGNETGVDCGGSCSACPSCNDGVQNGNETGVDCGGSCSACPTCSDGVQNGNETGVDCGGSCSACPTCSDGVQNGNETGVDCGGSCSPCSSGGGCATLDSESFESGWGIWNDGGSDCYRSTSYPNTGNYSARLRDNSSSSVMTTDNINMAGMNELQVAFSYYPVSMDNANEDFWLDVSIDGGSYWYELVEWSMNDEFVNNQRYNDVATITGGFTANTKVRFRCDASGNSDWVYIDDVVLTGCSSTIAPLANNDNAFHVHRTSEVMKTTTDVVGDRSLTLYPNPVRDFLYVRAANVSENATVQVVDITGKTIRTLALDSETQQINVSDLSEGLYFIRIQTGAEVMVEKFMKAN